MAQGTYVPGTAATDTFALRSGVALFGGFLGNEANLDDRLWDTYITTLSGDIGTPAIGDNVYHVVTGSGADGTAVLDGFRITRGNASVDGNDRGGGLLIVDGSPTLANLWLIYNEALLDGAGAYFEGSRLALDGVTFQLNASHGSGDHGGGGLACTGCTADLANVSFTGNVSSGRGGGLYLVDSTVTLAWATFQSNFATGGGGAMYARGSSPAIVNSSFLGNTAGLGGAMYNISGSSPTLTHVLFYGNSASAGTGGAIHNQSLSSPALVDVAFFGNSASAGGAIYNADRSSPSLSNCILSGNQATAGAGGAIYNTGASNPTVRNCTFTFNVAGAGDSMYNNGSTPVVSNSILWGSTSTQIGGASAGVSYSLVRGGATGSGNTDGDPLFVDADGADDAQGTPDDSVRLGASSPAIDAGSNALIASDSADLDGDGNRAEATPFDAGSSVRRRDVPASPDIGSGTSPIVDMGAFERGHVHYVYRGWTSGNHSGTSWADAYASLDDALAVAGLGDEIWVAAGTYVPAVRTDDADPRSVTFRLANGVALYGGFTGSETAREQRDWQAHTTILSGDVAGNDSGFINNGENCYHVVTTGGVDATAVLDGFTIRGGNADGGVPPSERLQGAGIYNIAGSPTLVNLLVTGNSAGTALNHGYGGGMYSDGVGQPSLQHVTLNANRAYYGGGMANLNGSNGLLADAAFTGNSGRVGTGSGLTGAGAGMYNQHSSPVLTRVTFTANSAGMGGAMVNVGSSPLLVRVDFTRNVGGNGGAMYNEWYSPRRSDPVLVNCGFYGNSASGSGGAVYGLSGTGPLFADTVFSGNTTAGAGGAIWSMGTPGIETAPVLRNVTMSGNHAGACGGGLFAYYYSDPVVANSVFGGNTADGGSAQICIGQLAEASVAYSLVEGGYAGEGNVDANPLFVRPPAPGGDGGWGTADDDYGDLRLQTNSPAIDAGSNAAVAADYADLDADGNTTEPLPYDLDGSPNLRFINHRRPDTGQGATPMVDMGAYESQTANYAPILDASGSPYLTAVLENAAEPAGDTIETIVSRGSGGDPIDDLDVGSPKGIAVTAVDDSHGSWQYRVGGGPWIPFGPVSPASAVVLAYGTDRIRFVPVAHFAGEVPEGITFVAWDQSDGLASGTTAVSVLPAGGSTPWSLASETASTSVTNVNDAPAGLSLSPSSVPEHQPAGTDVGVLQAADIDAGDTHSYALVTGAGSGDNALFAISGGRLRTAAPFDYEATNSHTVRVRTTDAGGLWYEESFTVSVVAVDEGPMAVGDAYSTVQNTDLAVAAPGLLANDSDADGQPLIAILAADPAHGAVTLQADGSFVYAPEAGFTGTDSFTYHAGDGSLMSPAAPVSITVATGGPVVSLTADSAEVSEGGGQVVLTIALSQPAARVVTIQYATVDGSAIAGQDYEGISGTLVLQPGEMSGTISIAIAGDAVHEETETFGFTLTRIVNARLGAPGSGTVTILDDDPAEEAPGSVICLPLLLHRQ
ncbi:MAG: Calx-beta domain-containing protein [Anaerolineae bacterium]